MKEEKGSGISTNLLILIAILAFLFRDTLFGASGLAQANAVNNLNQGYSQNTAVVEGLQNTVTTSQADIMGQLNSLVTGMNAVSANQTHQGGLLDQVISGLGGLTTEVGGIKQQLQLTDGRVLSLEQQFQEFRVNGGMVNDGVPTPAPLVTQ